MDLYSLLGLTRAATAGDIERAYRRLARRYHPGINPGDGMAEALFRQVQHAFTILGDVERRRAYDRARVDAGAGGDRGVGVASGFRFLGARVGR
jgi:molecular chaperone DnaJ